jgi:hypothetical protein
MVVVAVDAYCTWFDVQGGLVDGSRIHQTRGLLVLENMVQTSLVLNAHVNERYTHKVKIHM